MDKLLGEEQTHRVPLYSGKTLLGGSLLIGFALGVFVSPVLFTRSEVEKPAMNMMASPMSMTCLRVPAISVNAMQNTLRKNGVPPSPMEKFALTSFAATRNPSMKAQAKDEFEKLDYVTQTKLKQLSKDLVVRAAAFSPEDMAGVSAPLGFWDPAGFAKDEESVAQYRRAEIKHGRVCMSSSLGMLVADKFHPIFDNWNEGPFVSSMQSHFSETAVKNFWPAFWIMTAGHELATTFADYDGKEEFDYGFDPLNLTPDDPEKALEYKTMELNHGRWAMFCAAGIIAQELVTGTSVI
jgi:light-harvesting complex I chlorophyll a/b binding protein 1